MLNYNADHGVPYQRHTPSVLPVETVSDGGNHALLAVNSDDVSVAYQAELQLLLSMTQARRTMMDMTAVGPVTR